MFKLKSTILSLFSGLHRLRSHEFYVETFDFKSGLGDSAWLLYGLAARLLGMLAPYSARYDNLHLELI
jgi:fumarate reductase subunit D